MVDYSKRLLLALLMVIILVSLIIGGKQSIANAEGPNDTHLNWVLPADGIITDIFGSRNGHHKGIDIARSNGTPIVAADSGTVTKSYYSDTYGHVVFVKHQSGYETVYAHLKSRKVNEGDFINKGQIVGLMGNTGKSSGPHLHFEVHKKEWTVTKENSIDPFIIYGDGQVGQTVSAGDKKIDPALEVATKVDSSLKTYVVESGDTLWSIAEKFNMQIATIKERNHLHNEKIFPGQQLMISK
jgi:LysM repeat protein